MYYRVFFKIAVIFGLGPKVEQAKLIPCIDMYLK